MIKKTKEVKAEIVEPTKEAPKTLDVTFPNEDFNKMVDKINEIIKYVSN